MLNYWVNFWFSIMKKLLDFPHENVVNTKRWVVKVCAHLCHFLELWQTINWRISNNWVQIYYTYTREASTFFFLHIIQSVSAKWFWFFQFFGHNNWFLGSVWDHHMVCRLNLTVRDTPGFLLHIISSSAILEFIQIQEWRNQIQNFLLILRPIT